MHPRTCCSPTALILLLASGLLGCQGPGGNLEGGPCASGETAWRAKIPKEPLRPGRFAPGEILIRFGEGVDLPGAREVVGELGFRVEPGSEPRGTAWNRWLTVRIPDGTGVAEAMRKAACRPEIDYVQPNWIYRISPGGGP